MQQQEQLSLGVRSVAVGTTNPAKLAAVDSAIQRIWPTALVTGVQVASGIRAQPLSDEEAIRGATNRAHLTIKMKGTDLGIGIEGNTVEMAQGMFSTAWVVVMDQAGTFGLGSSGRFLLPKTVAQAIRQGGELGPLMDQWTGTQNTKHKQGAVEPVPGT